MCETERKGERGEWGDCRGAIRWEWEKPVPNTPPPLKRGEMPRRWGEREREWGEEERRERDWVGKGVQPR